MKNLISVLFILSFSFVFGQTQNIVATKINFVVVQADEFLGNDQFGFSYFIKNNVFSKTEDGKSLEYKNISLGKITRVDLQNPLKIVLFYENFNTVILLDNQLNETQKINLSENNIPINATAVGIASQNRLWIYNSLSQQIGLYDYLKSTFQSITPSFQGDLKHYESDFNTFQWIDEKLNWYSCAITGEITTLGKVGDFDQTQIIGPQLLLFSKDKKVFIQDLKNGKIHTLENIDESFKKISYKDQILAIFTSQGITNYKITIP